MPCPYYIRDMDFNILEFSPMMEELTGFSKAEALSMKCFDVFHSDVCGKNCVVQNHLKVSNKPVWNVYAEIKNKQGKLAENSSVSAKEIYTNLKQIEELVLDVSKKAVETNSKLKTSDKVIERLIEEIYNSKSKIDKLANIVEELSLKANHNSEISKNQTLAIKEVAVANRDLAKIIQDLRAQMNKLASNTHLG